MSKEALRLSNRRFTEYEAIAEKLTELGFGLYHLEKGSVDSRNRIRALKQGEGDWIFFEKFTKGFNPVLKALRKQGRQNEIGKAVSAFVEIAKFTSL